MFARPPDVLGSPFLEETLMRTLAMGLLTIATVLIAAPARTQTYDPSYPVCLQTYGIEGSYIECGYTLLPQCARSASGRAAECIVNPYFAGARAPSGARYRRQHGAH
jgi:hypothetical protein